jgi:hypothetical protein
MDLNVALNRTCLLFFSIYWMVVLLFKWKRQAKPTLMYICITNVCYVIYVIKHQYETNLMEQKLCLVLIDRCET